MAGSARRGRTPGDGGNVIPFPGNPSGPLMHPAFFKSQPSVVPAPPAVVPLLTVHVSLDDAQPPVVRTLELAGDLTLDAVHTVLQEAMGWWDSHLHGFRLPGQRWHFLTAFDIEEGDEGTAEADVRLDQVLRAVGDTLAYEYDFGDGWEHTLQVVAVRPREDIDRPARLLAGTGACPPEDVGGVHHYNAVADALRRRSAAPELDPELLAWLPEGFNPDAFALAAAQDAVAHVLEPLDLPVDLPAGVQELVVLADRPALRQILALFAEASAAGPLRPDDVVAAVRPWTTLLDVVGDGVTLTKAGRLPPTVVSTLFETLGYADVWIGKGNREDLTPPVAQLRRTARELGLVRVSAGRLLPTKKGAALRADSEGLLRLVAATLPLSSDDVERHAGTLALLFAAAGRSATVDVDKRAAQVLDGLGWSLDDGPVEWLDALHLMRPTWAVLEQVTDPRGSRLLARTALGM